MVENMVTGLEKIRDSEAIITGIFQYTLMAAWVVWLSTMSISSGVCTQQAERWKWPLLLRRTTWKRRSRRAASMTTQVQNTAQICLMASPNEVSTYAMRQNTPSTCSDRVWVRINPGRYSNLSVWHAKQKTTSSRLLHSTALPNLPPTLSSSKQLHTQTHMHPLLDPHQLLPPISPPRSLTSSLTLSPIATQSPLQTQSRCK